MFYFALYGVFTIVFSIILSVVYSFSPLPKFWKKHLKKRKTLFVIFAFLSGAFFMVSLEREMEGSTMTILWSVHALCFLVYFGWSGQKLFSDYRRIKSAEARRVQS